MKTPSAMVAMTLLISTIGQASAESRPTEVEQMMNCARDLAAWTRDASRGGHAATSVGYEDPALSREELDGNSFLLNPEINPKARTIKTNPAVMDVTTDQDIQKQTRRFLTLIGDQFRVLTVPVELVTPRVPSLGESAISNLISLPVAPLVLAMDSVANKNTVLDVSGTPYSVVVDPLKGTYSIQNEQNIKRPYSSRSISPQTVDVTAAKELMKAALIRAAGKLSPSFVNGSFVSTYGTTKYDNSAARHLDFSKTFGIQGIDKLSCYNIPGDTQIGQAVAAKAGDVIGLRVPLMERRGVASNDGSNAPANAKRAE